MKELKNVKTKINHQEPLSDFPDSSRRISHKGIDCIVFYNAKKFEAQVFVPYMFENYNYMTLGNQSVGD